MPYFYGYDGYKDYNLYEGTLTMLPTAKGTCSECGVEHSPNSPHNRDSLTYLFRFNNEHGRSPSWADAMAHCTLDVREKWRKSLEKRGINVDGGEK